MRYMFSISTLFVSFKGLLLYYGFNKSESLFSVTNLWILMPAFVLMVCLSRLVFHPRKLSGLQVAILGWLTTLLLHMCWNFGQFGAALGILSILPWGVFIALGLWGTMEKSFRMDVFGVTLIQIVAFGHGAFVIYEFLTGDILLRASNKVVNQDFFRYSGVSSSPVSTGLALTCGIFASFWAWIHAQSKWARGFAITTASTAVIGSIFCLGRLSLIAALLGLIFQARILLRRGLSLIFVLIAATVLCVFAGTEFFSVNGSIEYFLSAMNLNLGGNVERLLVYREQLTIITSSPSNLLIGSGSGSTGLLALNIFGDEETTESSLLRLLREFGIFGSTFFLLIIFFSLKSLIIGLFDKKYNFSSVIWLSIFLTVCLQSLFAEMLDGWVNSYLFWACIAVAGQMDRERLDDVTLFLSESPTFPTQLSPPRC